MSVDERKLCAEIAVIVGDILQLGGSRKDLEWDTMLFGHISELDSMSVVAVLVGLEEEYGITIDDDEVNAELFSTLGALCTFVASKICQSD